jgi:hypothetical protein
LLEEKREGGAEGEEDGGRIRRIDAFEEAREEVILVCSALLGLTLDEFGGDGYGEAIDVRMEEGNRAEREADLERFDDLEGGGEIGVDGGVPRVDGNET